jgi:hypothetical protein
MEISENSLKYAILGHSFQEYHLYKVPPSPCFIVIKWINFATQMFFDPKVLNYVKILWAFCNYHFPNLNYINAKLKFCIMQIWAKKREEILQNPKRSPKLPPSYDK